MSDKADPKECVVMIGMFSPDLNVLLKEEVKFENIASEFLSLKKLRSHKEQLEGHILSIGFLFSEREHADGFNEVCKPYEDSESSPVKAIQR